MSERLKGLIVVAFVAAAVLGCGSDDDDPSDGNTETPAEVADPQAGAEETEPAEPTVSTEPEPLPEPSEVGAQAIAATADCLYRDDLIVMNPDDADKLSGDDLETPSGTIVPVDEVGMYLDTPGGIDADAAAVLLDQVALFTTTGDPRAVAADIRNGALDGVPVGASPVHVTSVAGHWGFAPGGDLDPSDDLVVAPAVPDGSEPPTVLVLDTGLRRVDAWFESSVETLHPERDLEVAGALAGTGVAGHGSFIASLIAQQSPGAEIVMGRIGHTTGEKITGEHHQIVDIVDGVGTLLVPGHADETVYVSDGLQFLYAMIRARGVTTDVLSISSGTYECDIFDSLAVRAAVSLWFEENGAPIVASAGNDGRTDEAFIPSSYDEVVGVGIRNVSFSNAFDVAAPGAAVRGVHPSEPSTWSYWTGTSFAAPLAAVAIVDAEIDVTGVDGPDWATVQQSLDAVDWEVASS